MSGALPELTRRGSTPSSASLENTFLTNPLASSSSTRPLSSSSVRAAREDVRQHHRDGSSPSTMSTSEEVFSINRPTSASSAPVSALRPLMLTPEKTRRGSLKDWSTSTLLPSTMHGSQFIEEFGEEREEDANDHTNSATNLRKDAKMIMKEMNADEEEERCEGEDDGNPYAQIYEELAKSPELESEDTLSPMTPLFHDATQEQHTPPPLIAMSGLKITNMLEPVVEESFIESDGDTHGRSFIDEHHAAIDAGDDTVEPEQINTSTTSISVVAITTDVPLSAGRQSSESRHKRASRPTSLANNNNYDPRTRTSSVASSALSRPTCTSSTNATLNSVENAIVEHGHRLSAQALRTERFEMKSPIRDEHGYERDLLDFFKEEEEPAMYTQQLRQKSRSGSLPPEALQNDDRHGQNNKINLYLINLQIFGRERNHSLLNYNIIRRARSSYEVKKIDIVRLFKICYLLMLGSGNKLKLAMAMAMVITRLVRSLRLPTKRKTATSIFPPSSWVSSRSGNQWVMSESMLVYHGRVQQHNYQRFPSGTKRSQLPHMLNISVLEH